jgi:ribonucleoside-triphosphate reductase
MKIIKRDGREVSFQSEKIQLAVQKAFVAVDKELTDYAIEKGKNIAAYVEDYAQDKTLTIEDIQDLVEKGLMSTKRKDVARAYILYRNERNLNREANSPLIKTVGEKIASSNVENQNANVDEYSFGGRMGEATDTLMKKYALDYCIKAYSRWLHESNHIYIHDLGSYAVGMHNCLTVPFDDILAKGFNTRQTDVRPANSINTMFQLVAVVFQLQSLQQFGGVSASHLDWTAVPYVRKSFYKHYVEGLKYIEGFHYVPTGYRDTMSIEDPEYQSFPKVYQYAMDKTRKETQQAVEGMYHNLNTLQSRSGNQLPFTSINYGTCTLPEGRMVIKALLEGSLKGVGKLHKTSVFPCGIFQYMKGVNDKPGTPNYDLFQLAIQSTALRLYPNYANVDWSGNAGYDRNDPRTYFSTMGCRTANGWDINGFGQLKDGRGNICPVTIIMPTYAMEAKEAEGDNVENFLKLLDKAIADAKDMLIERFEYICNQKADSAKFMYENGTMAGYIPEEGIRSALKHGTLAIGNLGLAETLQILIGCDHTESRGMEVAKRIYQLFKDRCAEYKEEYRLNFGVYNTPAENLCYTSMKKFKATYGEIPNVSDKSFFTNSMHVPVWKDISAIDKIKCESELTGYSSAGCITYVELPGQVKFNLEALENLVHFAMNKDVPYFAINVPNDTCLECGYCDEIEDTCPKCGSKYIQKLRRVTGYLTGNYTTAFNPGKVEETNLRKKHLKLEIEKENENGGN